ncbi:hypothetical protein [Arthrobacter zhaoxinii]|uniref:hypothetical protein n=1 Tax=Arthrobacter zhaoxinii TaxID=2964616 RepID=UPI002103BD10|nr:hypothetical protein [Arthrobacter zhaoxinii]MCQ2002104.1 hypothetical protein [Arthrobacter zhaoxinii]
MKSTDTAIGANGGTGKGIARVTNIGYAVALLIVLGIAIYLLQTLPWDTRMSEGTPSSSRLSTATLPLPALMITPLLFLSLVWRLLRKRQRRVDKPVEIRDYILVLLVPLAVVLIESYLAYTLLVRGGALSG